MTGIHHSGERITVCHGDSLEVLRELPDDSLDAVVTDPPYALSFMGKDWDSLHPDPKIWEQCFRVLKPGGHLLSFGGTRTWHRLTCDIEDAGFEIRDSIAWLYGSGFPKSLDVSKAIDKTRRRDYVTAALRLGMSIPGRNVDDWTKEDHSPGDKWWAEFRAHLPTEDWQRLEREVVGQGKSGPAAIAYVRDGAGQYDITAPATDAAKQWQGWGSAMKPAFEPVVVARKPFKGTLAANVQAHGTGALNIDACRVGLNGDYKSKPNGRPSLTGLGDNYDPAVANKPDTVGRWPTNVVMDDSQSAVLDAETLPTKSTGGKGKKSLVHTMKNTYGDYSGETETGVNTFQNAGGLGDEGGVSRYFPTFKYQAKAPKKERPNVDGVAHPTVKPVELMRWLVRLVTPPDGWVLDPFAGSGTTGEAAVLEGMNCILIEKQDEYLPLIMERVRRVEE